MSTPSNYRFNSKRKLNYTYGNKNYTSEFISASQLHAYCMHDPILDFLNRHGSRLGFKRNSEIKDQQYNFSNFILNLGNIWEEKVIQHIINIVGVENTITIKTENFQKFVVSKERMDAAIKSRVPVIFQAYLQGDLYSDRYHGYVDILCRTDYLERIFTTESIDLTLPHKFAELLSDYKTKNIDYVAIDIKTTNFFNNKLESDYYDYIRAQLHLYAKMNNKHSTFALFIGKQSLNEDKKIVPYIVNIDKENIVSNIVNATRWLRTLETNGDNWTILPTPSVPELYPNMKNIQDGDWSIAKAKISEELKEITDLYYVGYSKRQYCHNRSIYSYMDEEFDTVIQETFRKSPALRSINGKNIQNDGWVLLNVLNIAKAQRRLDPLQRDPGSLQKSQNNVFNFKRLTYFPDYEQSIKDYKYIYIDIETVYNFYACIYDQYDLSKNDFIIQIGIGFVNNNNKWIYKSFEVQLLTVNEEIRIITECKDYLQAVLDMCDKICFVYYTKAENKVVSKIIDDLVYDITNKPIRTLDLNEVWMHSGIYLKGLLNYKLKDIIKVCNSMGLINLNYDKLKIRDGSEAMAAFMIADKAAKDNNLNSVNEEVIKSLKEYNEVDCKALYEVHNILYELK